MCASVLLSSVSDIMLSSDDQYGQLAPDKVHTSQSVPNSSLNRLKVCISGQLAPDKVHTSQSEMCVQTEMCVPCQELAVQIYTLIVK